MKNTKEDKYTLDIIQGVEGLCIGINDFRIAGPKPWGGGKVLHSWKFSLKDLQDAFPYLIITKK